MTTESKTTPLYPSVGGLLKGLKSKKIELFIDTVDREAGGARSHKSYFRDAVTKANIGDEHEGYITAEEATIMFAPFPKKGVGGKKGRLESTFAAAKKTDECKPVYGTLSSGDLGHFIQHVSDISFPAAVADVANRLDFATTAPDARIKAFPLVKKTLGSINNAYDPKKLAEYKAKADWRYGYTLRFDKVNGNAIGCSYVKCININGKIVNAQLDVNGDNVHTHLARGFITNLVFTMNRVTRTAANGDVTFYLGFDVSMIIIKAVQKTMDPCKFFSQSAMSSMATTPQIATTEDGENDGENSDDQYDDDEKNRERVVLSSGSSSSDIAAQLAMMSTK